MGESSEPRLDFIQDFTLKSLRLKPDKWARMVVSDEQRTFIMSFVERALPQVSLYPNANVIERYDLHKSTVFRSW